MAFGTPGGDQQDQWSLHVFLRHVHLGMNLQEAIDAPAFHTEHAPSSFYPREARPGHLALEGRFPRATIEELRRRGHEVELCGDWSLGRVSAAAKDGALLKAAANPRTCRATRSGADLAGADSRHNRLIILSAGARRATREVNSIGSGRPPPGRVITQEFTDVRCLGWTNAASAAADGPPVAIVEQELPFALLDPLTQIRGTALVRAGGCTTIDEPGRIPGARRADRLSAAVVRIHALAPARSTPALHGSDARRPGETSIWRWHSRPRACA